MDIEMHIEAQKQIREAEWSVRTAKHARMRELRNAYVEEKEAGRVKSELISEDHIAKTISNYLASNEYDVMLDRRKEVAKQKFRCPCCDTDQIQLVSWTHKVVDLRCRKCKRKFIWESPI
ncbi:NrdC-like thioredoxin [Aeromonas phage AS-gz]|uniref:Thioredoxin n=1 Tax=Aeromonas phage AS-gz TaxID=2026082 RepID=A0A223LG12_9CAUD|nr:NrdC-like thioredoxin [Aeromonas phage AS-gz]ASU00701.1 thioredoxin [Aeromonas phage AS-gz]